MFPFLQHINVINSDSQDETELGSGLAAPASTLKSTAYLSLKCELNSVVEQRAGTSLPPSVVAVKAFQQTAGKNNSHLRGI